VAKFPYKIVTQREGNTPSPFKNRGKRQPNGIKWCGFSVCSSRKIEYQDTFDIDRMISWLIGNWVTLIMIHRWPGKVIRLLSAYSSCVFSVHYRCYIWQLYMYVCVCIDIYILLLDDKLVKLELNLWILLICFLLRSETKQKYMR